MRQLTKEFYGNLQELTEGFRINEKEKLEREEHTSHSFDMEYEDSEVGTPEYVGIVRAAITLQRLLEADRRREIARQELFQAEAIVRHLGSRNRSVSLDDALSIVQRKMF